MTIRKPLLFAALLLALSPCAPAQADKHADSATHNSEFNYDHKDAHFFRLDFAVEERDGARVLNRREYHMMVSSDDSSTLRSGDRVPIVTTAEKGEKGDLQYQWVDMGISFEARHASLENEAVALTLNTEMTSVPEGKTPLTDAIIRNHVWQSRVLLPLNKATTVYTSDDANSTHMLAVVVTPSLVR